MSTFPRRFLVAALGVLLPIGFGCNKILGLDNHSLASGGASGTAGTGGTTGGTSGTAGTGGTGTGASCSVDASVMDGDVADAAAVPTCGFVVPNFGPGLPNQASYTANTDQTVTDNVTKLTWEGLVDNRTVPQSEAARYCEEKEQSKGPWRLPTLAELMSVVDFTLAKPGPTISTTFPDRPAQKFWTSSHAPCGTPKGWFVDFSSGAAHQEVDNVLMRVRCVRGALPNCPTTRYSIPGDGTVHDATTGLTWQQTVAVSQHLNWSDASAYCPTLGNGWRLPSPDELETLVDLTKECTPGVSTDQETPIDIGKFPATPCDFFWASLPQAGGIQPPSAWYVAFVHGHIDVTPVTGTWWTRCVRWDGP